MKTCLTERHGEAAIDTEVSVNLARKLRQLEFGFKDEPAGVA